MRARACLTHSRAQIPFIVFGIDYQCRSISWWKRENLLPTSQGTNANLARASAKQSEGSSQARTKTGSKEQVIIVSWPTGELHGSSSSATSPTGSLNLVEEPLHVVLPRVKSLKHPQSAQALQIEVVARTPRGIGSESTLASETQFHMMNPMKAEWME
jgi:hypothetical protein